MSEELLIDFPTPDFSGLSPDKFDATWRSACVIEPCSVASVERFMQEHYLKKRPAIVLLCLRMVVRNFPVGAIVYSAPPREANARYGGEVWELARLFIADEIPRNGETFLIGSSVRFIRRHHSNVDFLLSYADPGVGHAGTIYKAANWISDGMTDADRKTPRFDYIDENTGQKYGRRGNIPSGARIGKIPRGSKHRFYLRLK